MTKSDWLKIIATASLTWLGTLGAGLYSAGKSTSATAARIAAVELKAAENSAKIEMIEKDQRIHRDMLIEFRAEQRSHNQALLDRLNRIESRMR